MALHVLHDFLGTCMHVPQHSASGGIGSNGLQGGECLFLGQCASKPGRGARSLLQTGHVRGLATRSRKNYPGQTTGFPEPSSIRVAEACLEISRPGNKCLRLPITHLNLSSKSRTHGERSGPNPKHLEVSTPRFASSARPRHLLKCPSLCPRALIHRQEN